MDTLVPFTLGITSYLFLVPRTVIIDYFCPQAGPQLSDIRFSLLFSPPY